MDSSPAISISYSAFATLPVCVCVEKCFLVKRLEKARKTNSSRFLNNRLALGSKLSRLHIDDTTVGKKNEKRRKDDSHFLMMMEDLPVSSRK